MVIPGGTLHSYSGSFPHIVWCVSHGRYKFNSFPVIPVLQRHCSSHFSTQICDLLGLNVENVQRSFLLKWQVYLKNLGSFDLNCGNRFWNHSCNCDGAAFLAQAACHAHRHDCSNSSCFRSPFGCGDNRKPLRRFAPHVACSFITKVRTCPNRTFSETSLYYCLAGGN